MKLVILVFAGLLVSGSATASNDDFSKFCEYTGISTFEMIDKADVAHNDAKSFENKYVFYNNEEKEMAKLAREHALIYLKHAEVAALQYQVFCKD